jgi:hypothetical protein
MYAGLSPGAASSTDWTVPGILEDAAREGELQDGINGEFIEHFRQVVITFLDGIGG